MTTWRNMTIDMSTCLSMILVALLTPGITACSVPGTLNSIEIKRLIFLNQSPRHCKM